MTTAGGFAEKLGQLITPGWMISSESNSLTSRRTWDRLVTWREANGVFPGKLLVTSTSRTPDGMCSPLGRVTTHCDWDSA